MPLIIGADGVMVPIRPLEKTPKGKTIWREVKVAILTRLGYQLSCTGKQISRLYHRRMVAILGDIDSLRPLLWLEALRQGLKTAECVVWISDGGRGFWRLYHECFGNWAGAQALRAAQFAILDFYHAAQNLWKAATAALDGRTTKARQW